MTEYELYKLCKRNPNCDCKCIKCPLFAKYINSQKQITMETEKKYKLTDECIIIDGHKLYRIEALKYFFDVQKGDQGGFIEREDNMEIVGSMTMQKSMVVLWQLAMLGSVTMQQSVAMQKYRAMQG